MDGEWRVMTIGDLAAVRSDRVMPSRRSDEPYVGLEHIESESGRLIGVGRAGDTVSLKTPFQAGDILYGKLRPALRKVLHAPICGLASTEILAVVPKLASDGPFVKHILHSDHVLSWALQGAEGTKMPRTSWQRLSGFEFLCPPPAERAAIAATLDAIADAIEKTEAVIAATEDVRKALLQELLTRGVPGWHTEWKTVPGIGTIPACWEVVRLGEVLAATQYGTNASLDDGPDGIPVLRMGNLQDGRIDWKGLKYAACELHELANLMLQEDDILFNRTNSIDLVGKVSLAERVPFPSSFASYLVRLQVARPIADAHWLNSYLNVDATQERVRRMATKGASQANINPTNLKTLVMPRPELIEQQAISRAIRCIEGREIHERAFLAQLKTTKSELADALLSGQLRVSCKFNGGETE